MNKNGQIGVGASVWVAPCQQTGTVLARHSGVAIDDPFNPSPYPGWVPGTFGRRPTWDQCGRCMVRLLDGLVVYAARAEVEVVSEPVGAAAAGRRGEAA